MSQPETGERILKLLEELRADQKRQLEHQEEALALQKQHLEILMSQQEKTSRIQDRAEALQERSAQIVRRVQRFFPIAAAVVVVLIIYVSWLLLRFFR